MTKVFDEMDNFTYWFIRVPFALILILGLVCIMALVGFQEAFKNDN